MRISLGIELQGHVVSTHQSLTPVVLQACRRNRLYGCKRSYDLRKERFKYPMQDVHKSVGRRRLMAEPVPNANSQQQQAQQGGAAQASPIFAEEAGQIEPKRTRGRSVIPRVPGTSPSGTQQADSAPGLKDAGSSPIPDAPVQQREASGAGVIDTCAPACYRPADAAASSCESVLVVAHGIRLLHSTQKIQLAPGQEDCNTS